MPTTIRKFMTQAVNVIKNINLVGIGKNMIQGLINGIKGMAGSVTGAIKNVVSGAISSAKAVLGIKSPSRVFRQIGDDTGQGLILGLEDKESSVIKASKRLSNGVVSGYKANINTSFTNGNTQASNGNNSISLNIENFNNNTDKDIEYLANELAFYMSRKRIGGAF